MKIIEVSKNPPNGWAQWMFHEDARISYIDDMPHMILEAALKTFNNNEIFCVTFDAEGYDYTIVSYDNYDVELIMRKEEEPTIFRLNYNFGQFLSAFIDAIENDINYWVDFSCNNDYEYVEEKIQNNVKSYDVQHEHYKRKIIDLILKLREKLKENEIRYEI